MGDRVGNRVVVQPDGRRKHPATRDFELLQLLITNSPSVIRRNRILDVLWGVDSFLNPRSIDNMIVRLRQVLGDAGDVAPGMLLTQVRANTQGWDERE